MVSTRIPQLWACVLELGLGPETPAQGAFGRLVTCYAERLLANEAQPHLSRGH